MVCLFRRPHGQPTYCHLRQALARKIGKPVIARGLHKLRINQLRRHKIKSAFAQIILRIQTRVPNKQDESWSLLPARLRKLQKVFNCLWRLLPIAELVIEIFHVCHGYHKPLAFPECPQRRYTVYEVTMSNNYKICPLSCLTPAGDLVFHYGIWPPAFGEGKHRARPSSRRSDLNSKPSSLLLHLANNLKQIGRVRDVQDSYVAGVESPNHDLLFR